MVEIRDGKKDGKCKHQINLQEPFISFERQSLCRMVNKYNSLLL